MQANSRRALFVVLACLLLSGCNFPLSAYTPGTPNPTDYIMTLSALQTQAVMTATSEGISGGAPTQAPIPVSGGTPGTQMVTVLNDTLCWRGPGPAYETVSAVFKGTQVQLLGRTVLPAWYIIRDPLFQDPCWIQASDLQVDQSLLASLPVYPVPVLIAATPTPSLLRSTPSPVPGLPTSTSLPPTIPPATSTLPPPTPTPVTAPTATPPAPTSTTAPPTAAPTTSPPTSGPTATP